MCRQGASKFIVFGTIRSSPVAVFTAKTEKQPISYNIISVTLLYENILPHTKSGEPIKAPE